MYTTGQLFSRLGVPVWALRRALDKFFPDSVERVVAVRVVPASILPAIEAKMRELGYGNGATPRSPKLQTA